MHIKLTKNLRTDLVQARQHVSGEPCSVLIVTLHNHDGAKHNNLPVLQYIGCLDLYNFF